MFLDLFLEISGSIPDLASRKNIVRPLYMINMESGKTKWKTMTPQKGPGIEKRILPWGGK